MKHCWSCSKSNSCPKFSTKKKACKEHKFAKGFRSETLKKKELTNFRQYESICTSS